MKTSSLKTQFVKFHGRRAFLSSACVGLALFLAPNAGMTQQVLHGHAALVAGLQAVGAPPAEQPLELAFSLPLRNQAALNTLLEQIYDPSSTNYHRYLTPEQFTEQFGPTVQDYETVAAYATAHGLTVTHRHPNRTILDARGSVADIEKLFHVKIRTYHHPKENRQFYAPDSDPSFDLAVPVLKVEGLSDYAKARPASFKRSAAQATPSAGTGPSGAYWGYDFRLAYVRTYPPGTGAIGTGQSVALVQFDGYDPGAIDDYFGNFDPDGPNPYLGPTFPDGAPLTNVLVDGFDGSVGPNNSEVALDIEMVLCMAPGLSSVLVYEGPNGTVVNFNDVLNRIATDNLAKQISCSWTWNDFGGDAGVTNGTTHQIFQQYATQGQSFFQASGDSDAYHPDTNVYIPGLGYLRYSCNPIGDSQPVEDPLITVVGGTTLAMSGGAWQSETVWNWAPRTGDNDPFGIGSSGGVSTNFAIPSWQQGICMSGNQGSATMRNIPDVAMVADNIWVVYSGPQGPTGGAFGGTSCAAPLWAGFTALLNQYAAIYGQPPVGFLNPALYALGKGQGYSSAFNDITTGNNTNTCSDNTYANWTGQFHAVPGYDLCTGWGTPNGFFNFLDNILNPPSPPTPQVSVTLAGPPDIYKGYTGIGYPYGGFTWFTFSRSGSTGSPLMVTFLLGGDRNDPNSTPDWDYIPCDAYYQLDFTTAGCNKAPFPNGFYFTMPACQSSVTIGVNTVDSASYCDDPQILKCTIPSGVSTYTPAPGAGEATANIHPDNNQ